MVFLLELSLTHVINYFSRALINVSVWQVCLCCGASNEDNVSY